MTIMINAIVIIEEIFAASCIQIDDNPIKSTGARFTSSSCAQVFNKFCLKLQKKNRSNSMVKRYLYYNLKKN